MMIGFGCVNRVTAFCGNHIGSPKTLPASNVFHLHSAQRTAEFALIKLMTTAFVHVNALVFRDFCNFF